MWPRRYMDLTEAMAHSNNDYFQAVGERLGFERSRNTRTARLGRIGRPEFRRRTAGRVATAPPAFGGIARMSSFGSGIRMTPLQLASLVSTLANGGTMYYLQYPRTAEARANFTPQIKRKLDIGPLVPDLQEGMLAAVSTARASPATILTANKPSARPALATTKVSAGGSAGSFPMPTRPIRRS